MRGLQEIHWWQAREMGEGQVGDLRDWSELKWRDTCLSYLGGGGTQDSSRSQRMEALCRGPVNTEGSVVSCSGGCPCPGGSGKWGSL